MKLRGIESRGRLCVARLLLFLGCLTGCAGSSAAPGSPAASVPSTGPLRASFTVEQATLGQRAFTSVCSTCHSRNEFTGPIFSLTWMAEPVGHLFEHISTNMPQDKPGSLSASEYASIVAYILQLNGRPAGQEELPTDADLLTRMRW